MHFQAVQNATQMPTDGISAGAAERENGNLTAVTQTSATCSAGAATAIAGDLILTSTGHWAEVTGPAVATVLPVKEWKTWGVNPQPSNTGVLHPLPPIGITTYRIFPASVLQYMRRGVRIKKANVLGVAGATLVINGPTGAAAINIPAAVASESLFDYGEGRLIKGPFTVALSNHAVVATIEFVPEGA